jgi:cytochrome oxidase assembly protein ShyY1
MKNFIAKTITLITIFFLIGLGIWQLLRMKEKNEFLDMLNQRMNTEVVKVSNIHQNLLYRNVNMCGVFFPQKDTFIYANPYYLTLAPFQISDSNEIIMVARGRIHQQEKIENSDYKVKEDSAEKCISGMLVNSEKSTSFMPEMDGSFKKPFLSISTQEIGKVLGLDLADYYLIQTENMEELEEINLHPMALKSPDQIYNNHIEYALTWFMLAAILFLMFASTFRRKEK